MDVGWPDDRRNPFPGRDRIATDAGGRNWNGASGAIDADVSRGKPAREFVAVRLGRKDQIDGAGVAVDQVCPDRPEIWMLFWSLWYFLAHQNDAALGMGLGDPFEPNLSRNRLAAIAHTSTTSSST